MPLLFEIQYGSHFVYSPQGTGETSRKSRILRDALKRDGFLLTGEAKTHTRAIPWMVGLLANDLATSGLRPIFADLPIVVPAPQSSLSKPGTVMPNLAICEALVAAGLASGVQNLVQRTIAVPKSAFQKPADRTTPQRHYETIAVVDCQLNLAPILVVDDIVTSGSVLIASVSRIKDAFPNRKVTSFALVRTMSQVEIENVIQPSIGVIKMNGERSRRIP